MDLDLSDTPEQVIAHFALDRLPTGRSEKSMPELLRLDGRRALVTGGGGAGLGAATCARLAEQGADVAVLDVDAEAARSTCEDIASRFDVLAEPLAADVGDAEQVREAIEGLVDQWGAVDILVNNAGGSGTVGAGGGAVTQHGPFVSMRLEDLHGVVRVNLLGALLVTHAVLPHMLERGTGRIVNVASEGGRAPIPDLAVYNSCKAGVIGFTRSLGAEVGPLGVSVVGVCPGIMVSQRTVRSMSDPSGRGYASLEAAFGRVTLGRCTDIDEVAGVISFLSSPAGDFIHGTSVSVGGGMAD